MQKNYLQKYFAKIKIIFKNILLKYNLCQNI